MLTGDNLGNRLDRPLPHSCPPTFSVAQRSTTRECACEKHGQERKKYLALCAGEATLMVHVPIGLDAPAFECFAAFVAPPAKGVSLAGWVVGLLVAQHKLQIGKLLGTIRTNCVA